MDKVNTDEYCPRCGDILKGQSVGSWYSHVCKSCKYMREERISKETLSWID